jgi:GDP-L-fucose synthase
MDYLENKTVLVTGGAGFLDSYLVRRLSDIGVKRVFPPNIEQYDLRERDDIKRLLTESEPDIIIHLAAEFGATGASRATPGQNFYNDAIMGIQLMELARQSGVKKFVTVGTIQSYPQFAPLPWREDDFWFGYPERTSAPYALANKMLLVQAQAYRQQYGFNAIYLLPADTYGPGDDFTPDSSHVMLLLIKKIVDALRKGEKETILEGNGTAKMEFLYVEDCAEAIVLATERYDKPEPVNIGSGSQISISELMNLIRELTAFKGKILWDRSKAESQTRTVDSTRADREIGFKARTRLQEGLRRTIDWYLVNSPR